MRGISPHAGLLPVSSPRDLVKLPGRARIRYYILLVNRSPNQVVLRMCSTFFSAILYSRAYGEGPKLTRSSPVSGTCVLTVIPLTKEKSNAPLHGYPPQSRRFNRR